MTTATEKLRSVRLSDEEAAFEVIRAFLEERGDLPLEVLFDLSMHQEDPTGFERRALRLRAEWFRKRGERVPKLTKPKHDIE